MLEKKSENSENTATVKGDGNMRLLLKLISGVLGGIAAHQAYRPSFSMGDRTGALFRNAVGGMILLPFLLLLCEDFEEISNTRVRLMATYLVNLGSVGTGVFLGHLIDENK